MSTTGTALALPTDGDSDHWSAQERALVAAAGLVRQEKKNGSTKEYLADRPTVEAFLQHCRRTGLDPIARQIYAIYRGGKWGIQISIDGARLVAERSGKYQGQTPPEWTDGTMTKVPLREDGKLVRDGSGNLVMVDDYLWVTAWVKDGYPKAARVGVKHSDFPEAQYATARWETYVVMNDEWAGDYGKREKTGNKVVSEMWAKMPDLMLSKVAEMLALRKAFPQDLSGLYSTEEMQQADKSPSAQPAVQRPAAVRPDTAEEANARDGRDWIAEILAAKTYPDLKALADESQALGAWSVVIDNPDGGKWTVKDALFARRAELQPQTLDVQVETVAERPRQWVVEARPMQTRAEVLALASEARAKGATESVLEELVEIVESLPETGMTNDEWPTPEGATDREWSEGAAAVLDDEGSSEYGAQR